MRGVIDAMQERLDRRSDAMRIRRATVEHPFGTLKAWMGATHFKTRTLDKVRTEMSLHVLAYNLKQVLPLKLDELRGAILPAAAKRVFAVREIEGDGFLPRTVYPELAIYKEAAVERLAAR